MALNTSLWEAVTFHAQPRFTKDIDFFIKADTANARATYAALADFGAALQGVRPDDFADRSSFFRFGREPRGIDILPDIPGVDFDAAWVRRVETVVDPASALKANFISAEDLIAAKLAAARPQDIADVEAIRKATSGAARGKKGTPEKNGPRSVKPASNVYAAFAPVEFFTPIVMGP